MSLRIYIKILKIHRTEAVWQQILGEITSLQHHWWTDPGARRMFPSLLAVTPQHVAYVLFLKTDVMLLFKTGYCRCSGSPQSARKTADGPSLPQSWNAVEGQNPYLEVPAKRLISFSELCPLKQKTEKTYLRMFAVSAKTCRCWETLVSEPFLLCHYDTWPVSFPVYLMHFNSDVLIANMYTMWWHPGTRMDSSW